MSDPLVETFIARWKDSGAAERANYQLFLAELCDVLGVPRPDPTSADPTKNRYVFERAVDLKHPDGTVTTGRIDCYFATRFVCETKQGVDIATPGADAALAAKPVIQRSGHGKRGTAAFDRALDRAFHQGRNYITALPAAEGRPPFLMIIDVGHSIDLYAEFTGTGGHYERFPDPANHRILLTDLRKPEIRERLRAIWLDPHSLDPSKHAAAVTRDIADRLARLANSLEADGHDPMIIAGFLQRCLFTMFAEDMGLLPADGFKSLLDRLKDNPHGFPVLISGLWKEMATGTAFSTLLFQEIACFNGGLFETTTALPVNPAQLAMLADAAATDWSAVEPSIFGTLLTRALDARERHKLGAEYTPRAYVERLVRPAIIDPLRQEWESTRIAAANLHQLADEALDAAETKDTQAMALLAAGKSTEAKDTGSAARKARDEARRKDAEALALVTAFHHRLCAITVLDPACGTANFLYVTLEHFKRLEAEVLEILTALGGDATLEMQGSKVRPEQFLGLEINHQAVAIAQLVLWIGYFQWQQKTTGKADTGDRPLLPKTRTIQQQDAVLAYDAKIPRVDPATGATLTIWDGHSTKAHPVTGKEVPDESARTVLFDFTNPRPATWPQADFIVGNPPFIGASRMRDALGDGYTEALRQAWKGKVPESADFVMFWWQMAAGLVAHGKAKAFGFITTNSIHQTFNRRILESCLADESHPLHLAYAIPDHPWIDSADGAAVRIAMTVAAPGKGEGVLDKVTSEAGAKDGEVAVTLQSSRGTIAANLQVGADVTTCLLLVSNLGLASEGVKPHGMGFVLKDNERTEILSKEENAMLVIKPYKNGRDIVQDDRDVHIIDLHGMSEDEVRRNVPCLYQHVFTHVKPERDAKGHSKDGASYAKYWWLFGKTRGDMRKAIASLSRYIVTVKTAKHRVFVFLNGNALPDSKLIAVASDDASVLAVLSSNVHGIWTLKIGSHLGVGNDPTYVVGASFNKFPFPALHDGPLKDRLRDLGERLDGHRKARQAAHPDLTLTGMYNVLEKLRGGEPLTVKDKDIHDKGLVTLLKQIHDDIDAAVLEAYGWEDLGGVFSGQISVFSGGEDATEQAIVSDCGGKRQRDTALGDEPPTSGNIPVTHTSPNPNSTIINRQSSSLHALADLLARSGPDADALSQSLLTRLVALNHERAAEEKRGLIRWLRPDYQAPQECTTGVPPVAPGSELQPSSFSPHPSHQPADLPSSSPLKTENCKLPTPATPLAWPADLPAQVLSIRNLIPVHGPDPALLSACFGSKNRKRIEQIKGIIKTLELLG